MSDPSSAGVYRVGDAVDVLRELDADSAAVVCLDDAWARPGRQGEFGVEYPTHEFNQTAEILEVSWRVLKPGGWLIADADDWLAPRLETFIRERFGDVTAYGDYAGGGYRRRGGVTYVDAAGEPDRSTAGMYLSNGGYSVVFAHKGDTDRQTKASARQLARHPRRVEDGYPYNWGSVKPVEPYQHWLDGLCSRGEQVVVPCAGTAPAAIAADRLGLEWTAVDLEPEAREAFRRRKSDLQDSAQSTLGTVVSDD